VVTQQNLMYVVGLVNFAIRNNINLLLLDLLQASSTDAVFDNAYYHLLGIEKMMCEHNLSMVRINENVRDFYNSNSNIRIVEHYADVKSRCAYCTRALKYNPILLTPNFKLSACTHFGKRTFCVEEFVKNRDADGLYETIKNMKDYLISCSECREKTILSDKLLQTAM
jgi:hypothetical protein